jgi:aspartate/methionine/tyrosine aminotransferase
MALFQPFLMERFMSKHEKAVDYNLSESGVYPLLLEELLAFKENAHLDLLKTDLDYAYANGDPELRENIARQYGGATLNNVLVTVGAIEANYIATQTLVNRGDEIVIMLPNYMQIWGISKNRDYLVKTFSLLEENDWKPDLDTLEKIVSDKTRMIAICNPNNPTGYILKESEMDAIVGIADKTGAWILADEVYGGAEQLTDSETPSFYGRYEKVIAVGSLSKAYGLPGLRTGWLVGPEDVVDRIWARHEYLTLSTSMLSNKLAALALSVEVRPAIIKRTRDYIRKGYPVLKEWMARQEIFSCVPPQAAAIAFIKYDLDINSTELTNRLVDEKKILIVPGDHFGIDNYLRISFGLPKDYLLEGLIRIQELLTTLR